MYFTLDDRRIRHAARNIEQGGSLTIIATAPTGRRAGDRKSEAGSWNTATITERQSHSRCAAIQAAIKTIIADPVARSNSLTKRIPAASPAQLARDDAAMHSACDRHRIHVLTASDPNHPSPNH
jgi:hypothetical protein